MITSSPDSGRADYFVILWLFVWAAVGAFVWAWLITGGAGVPSAVFADAPR